MLGLAKAIHHFDPEKHTNGLAAYAVMWIIKELQTLAKLERRPGDEDRRPYGFGEGEFGLGIQMSFWPQVYPTVSYDENAYRRRSQYINLGDCVVENIKLGAPADDNDDVEYVGLSFISWSPINPETAFLFKEATWEKYKYRSAAEIAQMCDDQIDAAAVNAARRQWRDRKKDASIPNKPLAIDYSAMVSLPASVFAAV
jgi:hypothetical protein